nr:hypothetical protein [Tanacetum cinerariifolium]
EASLFDPEIVSIEEENTKSGNTTHADYSLSEYDSFCFEIELDQERLINLMKNDISDNSSNDPLLEEVDLFLSDNSIPPGEEIPVMLNDKDEDDYSSFIFVILLRCFLYSPLRARTQSLTLDYPPEIKVFLCWNFCPVSKIFISFDLYCLAIIFPPLCSNCKH